MNESESSSRWTRREFLRLGAASTTAAALACTTPGLRATGAGQRDSSPRLRTPLCDLLGTEYPLVQAGMGGVAGPELAAAVSSAGGLGILGGAFLPADELRRRIRRTRELTDRPFGVNLLMHSAMYPPADMAKVPDGVVRAVQGALNRFRERLGLTPTFSRPESLPDLIDAAFEVILDERVAVWSIGLGNPPPGMVRRCHAQGMKVIAMVATVDDARQVAASGVDAIVAQGAEAGGHHSTWVKRASPELAHIGTLVLVPEIVDAVKVPVIAAGGITDGRGLAASLMLGAAGALVGTRFVATRESMAVDFYKRALVERDSDSTTVTDAFSGLYARVLRNTFTEEYRASGAPVLPAYVQSRAARDITTAAAERQDPHYYPMWSGQGVGMIHDIPDAAAVVQSIVREARDILGALPRRVQLS